MVKKDVKSKVAAKKCSLAQNSPELSLLKFLPLTYHHSHFLAATLDLTSFFHHSLPEGHTLFLQLGYFGLDNNCNFYRLIIVTGSAKRGLIAFPIACTWQSIT